MSDAAPPREIPLFPIRGCILPPGEHLPLNVFEPRYLNMVDDARAGVGVIGVIQPRDEGPKARPALEPVGCVGRIASYEETDDGRYLIVLAGLARFRVIEELDTATPYRVARVDYAEFEDDLRPRPLADPADRTAFLALLRRFFEQEGMEADWPSIDQAPLNAVVNKVAMAVPFEPAAKQALLEAAGGAERAEALSALMSAALDAESDGPGSADRH
ncbi:peptidase S16 [Marinicauda salina]|uniref:Peptidase S16 n=1 Tax=Marinicauda salina TaxID=2135793 RepID=A0A2U2BVV2_9PROT|nr:LON peptidase substrate-binding domain-containing protein [Marinicauda salina]PWE18143.1 peptidase S16 [Marinicauda salina]